MIIRRQGVRMMDGSAGGKLEIVCAAEDLPRLFQGVLDLTSGEEGGCCGVLFVRAEERASVGARVGGARH